MDAHASWERGLVQAEGDPALRIGVAFRCSGVLRVAAGVLATAATFSRHAEIAQVRLASLQGRPTVQAEFKK